MPRAPCYYEILGVSEAATADEIKRAYKNKALVWHPDKNQANPEEAHAKFQAILKAYETLSDSREREWYDRHKDQILSDGDKEDLNCLNLFQYFSSTCYANFDDEEDGFYTVYRGVFEQIAEEERQAIQLAEKYAKGKSKSNKSIDDIFPPFGHSKSPYEDVVRPFYAFWSGFCTSSTFDNLDKYNTTEAENRRILRAMEKENKKIKDAARKERNTNVRKLVEFVKRRDRRLMAHRQMMEEQNELNRQKTAEKQRLQRERDLKEKAAYKPNAYLDMNDVEAQLEQLDNEYQDLKKGKRSRRRQKYLDESDEEEGGDEVELDAKQEDAATEASRPNSTVEGCKTGPPAMTSEAGSGDEADNAPTGQAHSDSDGEQVEGFLCAACDKEFRTIKAFENHEASKKHKQNVHKLTRLLKEQEGRLNE